MSNDNLDTLRPEVREAVDAFDIGARVGMTFGNKTWNTIRAELLHLAVRNAELEAKATRDHEWFNDLLTENKKAEAELAALKARIAGSVELTVGDPAWSDGTLSEMDGLRVALVRVEE